MSYKILVPLDGSELSERVFPLLHILAARHPQTEIELLRCYEPPSTVYLIPELAVPTTNGLFDNHLGTAILEYLELASKKLQELSVTTTIAVGDPPSEILDRSEGVDLIVMASHGRGGLGRWLLGGVTTKVTRGSTVPVLVVGGRAMKTDTIHPATLDKIVVAIDGSEAAERAVGHAAALAKAANTKLYLYQGVVQVAMHHQVVMEANKQDLIDAEIYLRELAETIEGVEVKTVVRDIAVSPGIVEFADEVEADLVVIGSHGKSGFARWLLGSEAERVLHESHCPVLITH